MDNDDPQTSPQAEIDDGPSPWKEVLPTPAETVTWDSPRRIGFVRKRVALYLETQADWLIVGAIDAEEAEYECRGAIEWLGRRIGLTLAEMGAAYDGGWRKAWEAAGAHRRAVEFAVRPLAWRRAASAVILEAAAKAAHEVGASFASEHLRRIALDVMTPIAKALARREGRK